MTVVNFRIKLISMLGYIVKMNSLPLLKIERIDINTNNDSVLIHFFYKYNQKKYAVPAKRLFAHTKLLKKFNSKDAAKIGYYCAKSLLKTDAL